MQKTTLPLNAINTVHFFSSEGGILLFHENFSILLVLQIQILRGKTKIISRIIRSGFGDWAENWCKLEEKKTVIINYKNDKNNTEILKTT